MAIATTSTSLDEFLNLPAQVPALEYLDGVITQKVSPKGVHSRLQLVLAGSLEAAGQRDQSALAFPELRVTFAGASRVPDIAVYRRDRVPTDPHGRVVDVFTTPPDVAVEIASPSQSVNALVRRCLWYVTHGVAIALVVDPADESVLIFRPDGALAACTGTDSIDLRDVLPTFALTVQELFASLRV